MNITIQHPETAGVRPYPFHVNEVGEVQRQDFWKGKPLYAIGFSVKPEPGQVDVDWESVDWQVPDGLVGMYLITEDEDGEWSTHTAPVAEVRVSDGE